MLLEAKHRDQRFCAAGIGGFLARCRHLLPCLLLLVTLQRTSLIFLCGEELAGAESALLREAAGELLLEGHNEVGAGGGAIRPLHRRCT